ncbi:alpha/beta hydrolase [Phenylobacterium soli]|uniref:Alpha/beta hydrolase n=1 Tax=Phenylobacterium soli TaxID=2170551 RepID=A0A328AE67_9CAUL|nr:alpha/beta hydrolase [Phenylobacterium soli]RAK53082.1 alpha/beta hydrolase [Phenylobacterium soli]
MASVATQRFIAHKLLSLPSPILRLMSGGGVVYQGGRTLDPRIQFLAAQGRNAPPMQTLSPEAARQANDAGVALVTGAPEPGVRIENLTVDGPGGAIPARAYRPEVQDPAAPLMVYAHMGGGVIGSLETSHVFCSIIAKCARAPILSVDYRLAPEHRFPAGLEDVLAAYRWARENTERFGAPKGLVAIGGDSMGGGFAAAVCQALKKAGEPQPALQLLVYPWVDVACESASMTIYGDAYPLNRPLLDWFAGHLMGPEDNPADPRLSPLAEKNLKGLAPAIVVTAGFDPLVDQGEAYARKLKEAGVPMVYRCYDSLSHGFTAFTGAVPCADTACREIAGLVREGFEGRIA